MALSCGTSASPDGISSNQVVCSFIDSEGRHWWGSYKGGLYWMEEMKVHRVDDQRLHYVVAMAEDGNGNLWLATGDEGLFCMNSDGRVNSYTVGNSLLSTNSLTDLAMADGHMLYVGTSNGLYRLDTQNHRFAQLSREHINTLLVDGHRQLWIGMRDGLGVMDVNAASHDIEVLRVSDGLAHNYVHGLAEDHFGNVWVSTMDGVTMVSTSEHPSGSGVKGTHRCTSYYEYDGLGNIVFNRHAIACMANGDILVGGIGALVRIVPDGNVRSAAMRHPVRFTGLTVGGRRIEVGQPTDDGRVLLPCNILQVDHLELKYSDTNIGIEVSSMNYLDLPHQHYVYRMDNQKEWSRMENNTVVLHRLAPGRYLLHVKVEEVDSSYQNPVATLSVVVSPPFWMSAAAFVLYAVLAVLAIVLIVMYLHRRNKRKLLQQRRELKAQQREEMQEAKMRFFINISHDLRTPLSLIITPVERLLKGTLAAPVRHQLELVQRNARLLMDDITQLLDFRKLDESLDLPQLTVGSLTAFVEESCRQFMEGVLPGDVTFSLRQDEDALLVKMDQVKMRRILFNLVSNAIKYNRRGGAVTVETRREEAMAVLAVADTGTGVKDKTRIFERFYQEPHSGDVPYTGSGIGLYMVKQYVSMLGGTIEANDNQPEGTVFEVRLPLTQLQPSAGESGDALPERKACEPDADVHVANSSTILIVEDNADFRSFLHGCLADHYTVVEATNGREALEVLQGRDVHLIVSDVMMPVMDGMELCRAVKTDVELSHIPFIMLTAKAADEHQAVGLREGADDYIVKPFNLEVLLLRIDRLLAWAKGARERFRKMDVKPSEITVSNVDERLIARAIELVEANMDNEAYSVEQLCDDMGMSRSSVYKKLMAITGLSPIHFIRTLRVKRGRQLLEQGGEAVSQVAWQVGLSPKQFARYFKDEYGISPSQLKR